MCRASKSASCCAEYRSTQQTLLPRLLCHSSAGPAETQQHQLHVQDPAWEDFQLPANVATPNSAYAVMEVDFMPGSLSGRMDGIANLSGDKYQQLKVNLSCTRAQPLQRAAEKKATF
jgi:hypothetical protein